MSKKFLAIAAALAVALPALAVAPSAFAQAAPATEQVQPAPTLPGVSGDNVQGEIMKSDKPVFVLVIGEKCDSCASITAALAAQAAKHPEWKFVQVKGAEVGIPDTAAPFVTIVVPGVGPTFETPNFALPADVDAFIAKRIEVVGKQTAAIAAVEAVKKQIADASKPFNDEMDALQGEAKTVLQPFNDRIAAIDADEEKALEPFNKREADIQTRRKAAAHPFIEKREVVAANLQKATADLRTEWDAVQAKLEELRKNGAKTDDQSIQAQIKRGKELQAEYAERAKPFNAEISSLNAQAAEARKPFRAELDALYQESEAAMQPFNESRTKVRTESREALKPLQEKADDVSKRKAAALGTLPADLRKAEDAFEATLSEPEEPAQK